MLATRNKIYTQKDVFYDENNSIVIHSKNKKVYNIFFYGKDDDVDTIVYYDEYKGRVRLNIDAHGTVDEKRFGDKGGRIIIEGRYYDGDDIAKVAQAFSENTPFDCIRLITCHSGEGGDSSLISKLSSALKLPVKGYEGTVDGYDLEGVGRYRKDYGTEVTKQMLIENQWLGRAPLVNEVRKGSGRYTRDGKTVMAGMEFF